jgi:hypothetical protein
MEKAAEKQAEDCHVPNSFAQTIVASTVANIPQCFPGVRAAFHMPDRNARQKLQWRSDFSESSENPISNL